MVEFELSNPLENFLFGVDLLDGYTNDITDGEETNVKILSVGFLLFKVSFLWIPN